MAPVAGFEAGRAAAAAAPGPVAPVAGGDPFSSMGLSVCGTPGLAKAAALASVSVNDAEARQQLGQLRGEAAELAAGLRHDAAAAVELLKATVEGPQGHLKVSNDEFSQTFELTHRDSSGKVDVYTRVTIGHEQPPAIDFEQTRNAGNTWQTRHRSVTGEGEHLHLTDRTEVTERGDGGTAPFDHNPFTSPDRLERTELQVKTDHGFIERETRHWTKDGEGAAHGRDADEVVRVSMREVAPGKCELPGEIEGAFDKGQPVLQRSVLHEVEPHLRRRKVLEEQKSWFQGNTRVTSQVADDQAGLLLEKQAPDGQSKDSQLFLRGTENTVRTHTEARADGSVKQVQELWDSNGKQVGDSSAPKLLTTATTERTFGSDGQLASQRQTTTDLKSRATRTDDYSRRVSADRVAYQVKTTLDDGKGGRSFSTMDSTGTLGPAGERTEHTVLKSPTQEVELTPLGDRGVSYQCLDVKSGKVVRGELDFDASAQTLTLKAGGKSATLGGASGLDLKGALERFDPEDLAGLSVALHEAPRFQNLKGLVGYGMEQGGRVVGAVTPWLDRRSFVQGEVDRGQALVASVRRSAAEATAAAATTTTTAANTADAVSDNGLLALVSDVASYVGFVGAGSEALQAFFDLRGGEVLRGALNAGKASVDGASTAANLFTHLSAGSLALRGLGAAGSALDVGLGVMRYQHADNRFGRLEAGAGMVTSGLQVGLALTATSGPAAPFLLGGLMLFEGVKFYAAQRERHYVAPMAEGFEAANPT